VPIPGQDPKQPAMANVLAMGAAHVNSVFVAAADRVGTERGQPFLGCSLICAYTGWPVAGPASRTEPETIIADLNLSEARRKRNWNDFNQILRDRRTDTYDTMLGITDPPVMLDIVRFAFDILAFTSVMVLIVLGLGVIASMMGIFNFAHGELVLLGAYTVFIVHDAGYNIWWGILLAPIVVGLFGVVLERTIIRRFYEAPIIAMLGTYAIGLIIREIVRGLLGGHYRSVPEPWGGSWSALGLDFSIWRTFIIVTTAGVIVGSWLFLVRTSFGLRIRGSLENAMLARACGISTNTLYTATFAFGAALAGLAGALVVPLYQLSADMGLRFLVQGFLSVMLGGVGTFEGPVLGAAAIGALASGLPWVVTPVLADPLVFVIALVIVKLRPQGFIAGARK
jgi:branched-chain amino acid transport system permease protein